MFCRETKALSCLSKWMYLFTFPLALNEISWCSTSSLAFGILLVMGFSHSNRCVVISPCINLHFSNGMWGGTSFHMLICHLYISLVRFLLRSLWHALIGLFFLLMCYLEIFGRGWGFSQEVLWSLTPPTPPTMFLRLYSGMLSKPGENRYCTRQSQTLERYVI